MMMMMMMISITIMIPYPRFHRSLNPPFLLLTQGGIEAMERLLRMHDYLKFSVI